MTTIAEQVNEIFDRTWTCDVAIAGLMLDLISEGGVPEDMSKEVSEELAQELDTTYEALLDTMEELAACYRKHAPGHVAEFRKALEKHLTV